MFIFSFRSFLLSALTFKLEVLPHSYSKGYPVVPAPFIEKAVLSPIELLLGILVEYKLTINVVVCFGLLFHFIYF